MTRSEILAKADSIVNGQREQAYGSPEDNFQVIASLWSDYLDDSLSPLDVALMMVLLKVARARTCVGLPTTDTFIDIAGYAACGGEIGGEK